MIGEHRLTLHETNQRGFVPVCSCGWIGLTRSTPANRNPKTKVMRRFPGITQDDAQREHAKHVERCRRPLVDRMNP